MQGHAYAAVKTGHDPDSADYLATFAFALAGLACMDGVSSSAELLKIGSLAAEFGLAAKATREPGKSA